MRAAAAFKRGDNSFQCFGLSVHSFKLCFPQCNSLSLYAAGTNVIAEQKDRHEPKRDHYRYQVAGCC